MKQCQNIILKNVKYIIKISNGLTQSSETQVPPKEFEESL